MFTIPVIHHPHTVAAPNFRTLDLNLLRVFDAVMSEGSLTRAADQLAMTQPAVSHAMKRLRGALGEELIARTPHGVRPTGFALAAWPAVREALARLRASLAPGGFDPADEAGGFRLALADATAAVLLPALAARIEALGARAALHAVPLATRDPLPLLLEGEADIAVGDFPDIVPALADAGDAARYRQQRLARCEYICVMRRAHPLAHGELTLDAYCEARHVRVSLSGHGASDVDRVLAQLQRTRHIALTVNQFLTAARVAARSDCLAVLPGGLLRAVASEPLAVRPLPFEMHSVEVSAVWHLRHDAGAGHRWLRERLCEVAGAAVGAASR